MKRFWRIALLTAAFGMPSLGWAQNRPYVDSESDRGSTLGTVIRVDSKNVSSTSAEADPACDVGCGPCEKGSKLSIFADYLYLKPRGTTVPYAVVQDGVGPLAVPRGPVGSLNGEYSSGVRFGAAISTGCDTKVGVIYTWYESEGDDSLRVPANRPFVLRSLVVHPANINAAADSLAATAHFEVSFQNVDVDFTKTLASNEWHRLAMSVGGRYSHLEQDFRSNFSILGATNVQTGIKFDGGGPRVGLESEFALCPGLWIYSKGAFSLLFGAFEATYLQQNVFNGEQARTNFTDERWVPVMEFEVGLGWRSCNDRLGITAGYQLAAWYNTVTTPTWIQSVQNNNFAANGNNLSNTLTFDGFFARVELRF